MSKRVVLEDGKGNKLHPMTLGKCVTTESGETVDGLVSKTQMFSPIITMDSSMDKVGVGNDIDVHSNVKDGAYEECVFEGRTLVNAMGTNESLYTGRREIVSGWRHLTTWTTDWNGWLQQDLSILKPNTTYGLFVWIKENNLTGNWSAHVSHSESVFLGVSSKVWKAGETGYEFRKMTTKDAFSPSTKTGVRTSTHNNCQVGEKIVYRTLLIEYQDGMENWGIEYFDGMCHSKMPILRNVGKNLFNAISYVSGIMEQKFYTVSGNKLQINATDSRFDSDYYTYKVKKGQTLTMSTNPKVPLRIYDTVAKTMAYGTIDGVATYTPNNDTEVGIKFIASTFPMLLDVQLEKSSVATSYEDYKTNILRTSEEVVLRSVGNVKDTYNALTGEYMKRIGEVVIDGSSDEVWGMNEVWSAGDVCSFFNTTLVQPKGVGITSDRLPSKTRNELVQGEIAISEGIRSDVGNIQVFIDKSKLTTTNVDGFKLWLSQNPITIQYPLTTPITTIIKPSTIPFAYANGHVILETGSSGQSLLPTLKYSVTTGRTGQITQNAKILRQQEKQIASLEDLLLTQIVQMDYERTLLQFDFELNTNGLG